MNAFHERGIDNAADYLQSSDQNPDLIRIYQATKSASRTEYCDWVNQHSHQFSPQTLILNQGNIPDNPTQKPNLIICLQPFNNIRRFNQLLEQANRILPNGGTIAIHGETSGMRRHLIHKRFPAGLAHVIAILDYLWNRVCCKFFITRPFYMACTHGVTRNFPRVEVLGRIAKAGFEICGDVLHDETLYITAIRKHEPDTRTPHYGILVRLPRKGKDGKTINVFKIRSMYAYSEYIQDYTYRINGLEEGGKLKDDFRVNKLGSFCRSRFIDELPMIINLLRGEIKLVGVRPISNQYFSLYTPEMQALHLSVKPGLFPPLYYDHPKPSSIEEIQESERRYIEQYKKHPFRTDWKYFWRMFNNIIFHHERSH
ncbi:MAG: sugar transferase [Paludibacteraceae bacterium]|nr:sugar transferase [Paludibacteraceae bacterium]